MKYSGYTGKLLQVDLSAGRVEVRDLDQGMAEKYIGGRGLAARILYDEIKAGADPYSNDNRLLFITGPAAGTLIPTSGRYGVGTKSPLTGGLSFGYAGGHFASNLKFAGFDGIIFQGRSEGPVYLLVNDDTIEIREAGRLWGRETIQTEEALKAELGGGFDIASIGPAGENMVSYAAIVNEQHVVGRAGQGAVMGWMNLKAVAVRGTGGVRMSLEGRAGLDEAFFLHKTIRDNPIRAGFRDVGTTGMLDPVNEIKGQPALNFGQTFFPEVSRINADQMRPWFTRFESCSGCPVACGSITKLNVDGKELVTERIEHQSLGALATNTGVSDLAKVFEAHDLCDRFGLDTISTGLSIAFGMECFENGILTKADTDGLDLRFGQAKVLKPMVEMIARKQGLGAVLAKGVRAAAAELGQGSEKYAMHIKGLEMPGYDPRAFFGMALNLATAARGADHNRAFTIAAEFLGVLGDFDRFAYEGKPKLVKDMQDSTVIIDSIIMCMFTVDLGISVDLYARAVNLATGMDINGQDVYTIGERVNTLERMFNLREGIDGGQDRLPQRFADEPGSGEEGRTVDVARMLPEYYELRGWDEDGVPTPQTLSKLGIKT
ncbi:MAG: aldehyde ferredoxin oxidoreductase family protein [Deltaproteobacteria bacterium]|nr:aldehyde ferredoxin oxidoreductase family protein [Deltaproteobacteria bacterium]